MPKQAATATMEGKRKRGRPRKRWGDEAEEELNIMGMNGQRPSGVEEYSMRNQGPLRNVGLKNI
jgi:hypothetical protein